MSTEKYRMFRQYMVNELKISREDIKEWVVDIAEQEMRKIVESDPQIVNKAALQLLSQGVLGYKPWNQLQREIVRELASRIDIGVKPRYIGDGTPEKESLTDLATEG